MDILYLLLLRPDGIDIVVVLRRSPYEIIRTFEERNYSPEKIRENVASEILGISFYDALKTFGKNKVIEFDATGKTSQQAAEEIVLLLQNNQNMKSEWSIGSHWSMKKVTYRNFLNIIKSIILTLFSEIYF